MLEETGEEHAGQNSDSICSERPGWGRGKGPGSGCLSRLDALGCLVHGIVLGSEKRQSRIKMCCGFMLNSLIPGQTSFGLDKLKP